MLQAFFLWLASTGNAYASGQTFADGITSIPPLTWICAVLISMAGGVTSVMMRRAKRLPPAPNQPPQAAYPLLPNLWLSFMGGMIGFFGCLASPIEISYGTMALIIAGSSVAGIEAVKRLPMFGGKSPPDNS